MNMEHLVENIIENLNDIEKIKQSLETLNDNNPEELIQLIKPFVAKHYKHFVSTNIYNDGWRTPIWCTDCDLLTNYRDSERCYVCNERKCEQHISDICYTCDNSICNNCKDKGYKFKGGEYEEGYCPDCAIERHKNKVKELLDYIKKANNY